MILGIAMIIAASYMNSQYKDSNQSINQSMWLQSLN